MEMRKVKIDNKMMDVVSFDNFANNKELYNNSSTAVEFGDKYVYPVRTQTDDRPGMYNAGAIDFFVDPSYENQSEYLKENVIDLSDVHTITELMSKQEKLKTLEREILTSPDKNLTIPEISELDSPAMKGLKKAITAKSINLDKYADRFGDSFANTKRNLKNHDVTLFMMNRFTQALDIKATLILEDRNPNVANPMNTKIVVDLSEYNEEE